MACLGQRLSTHSLHALPHVSIGECDASQDQLDCSLRYAACTKTESRITGRGNDVDDGRDKSEDGAEV